MVEEGIFSTPVNLLETVEDNIIEHFNYQVTIFLISTAPGRMCWSLWNWAAASVIPSFVHCQ